MSPVYQLGRRPLAFTELDDAAVEAVTKAKRGRPDKARETFVKHCRALLPTLARGKGDDEWHPVLHDDRDTWTRFGAVEGMLAAWEGRHPTMAPELGQPHEKTRCWGSACSHAYTTCRVALAMASA